MISVNDSEGLKKVMVVDSTENDLHQKILNICYSHWQEKPNNEWSYGDMIENSEKLYGSFVKWCVLIGKYNQQVCNGGHEQYHYNNYDGSDEGESICDIPLHEDLVELTEKYNINGVFDELLKILKSYEIIVDEDSDGEMCENDNLGELLNTDSLKNLDDQYYKICDKVLEDVQWIIVSNI